jgi:2-dehydropantoate 2-reductase
LEAGRDVTFLVRERRAAELAARGLSIRSPAGDVDLPAPPTIAASTLREPFDLIILSPKAYDLEGALDSFAPAIGPRTTILPLLNGMAHLDALDARFGAGHVLGGQCVISTSLDSDRRVIHLNNLQSLSFGERDGSHSVRAKAILSALSSARFEVRLSEHILQDMWEKWVFIAAAAGITCLMRAAIGDIVVAGEGDLATRLLAECAAIAAAYGVTPAEASLERSRSALTSTGSTFTASMLRDIENHARTEGEHILGDLLRRSVERNVSAPVLHIAYAHVKAYEARRARER